MLDVLATDRVNILWGIVMLVFTAAVLFAVFGAGWRMFHPRGRH